MKVIILYKNNIFIELVPLLNQAFGYLPSGHLSDLGRLQTVPPRWSGCRISIKSHYLVPLPIQANTYLGPTLTAKPTMIKSIFNALMFRSGENIYQLFSVLSAFFSVSHCTHLISQDEFSAIGSGEHPRGALFLKTQEQEQQYS